VCVSYNIVTHHNCQFVTFRQSELICDKHGDRIDREQQRGGGRVLGVLGITAVRGSFKFQVKMQGLMHFYCEKLLVARNRD